MPLSYGKYIAEHTLPLNNDLAYLRPAMRPAWLKTGPEDCCLEGADIEAICRNLIKQGEEAEGSLPICFEVPIAPEVEKYAALRLTAVLASADFADVEPDHGRVCRSAWLLGDSSSLNAPVPIENPADRLVAGQAGDFLPIVGTVLPDQIGFWQSEYFGLGIDLPMSYTLPSQGRVVCHNRGLVVETADGSAAKWIVWHDNYSPLYARGGHSRCGKLTTMPRKFVNDTALTHGRKLGWLVDFRLWKSEKDYEPLELKRQRHFFFG